MRDPHKIRHRRGVKAAQALGTIGAALPGPTPPPRPYAAGLSSQAALPAAEYRLPRKRVRIKFPIKTREALPEPEPNADKKADFEDKPTSTPKLDEIGSIPYNIC